MAVVLIGLLFSLSGSAVIINPPCGEVPIQQLNYQKFTEVDKFDSSLGDLKSVKVTVTACGYASRVLTNEDPIPVGVDYIAVLTANMISDIPGIGEEIFSIATTDNFHLGLGETHTIQIGSAQNPECDVGDFTLTDPAEMAPYIGNAGDKVTIPVRTNSNIQVEGSTEWSSTGSTFMGVTICVEYEYETPFCISGTKTNACTDEGLPGWTIELKKDGAVIDSKPTGPDGSYQFCDLLPGDYEVCEVMQAGWKPVGPTCIPLPQQDETIEGVDFANEPPFCISGYKINDATGLGLKDWTINLKDASGAQIATTTTGEDGSYQFCDLFSGTYTICEVLKPDWTAVGPTCITVTLDCADVPDNNFRNKPTPPPYCGGGCPWYLKSEAYRAQCGVPLVVDASHGILYNDRIGATVIAPELITIDPKYGTIAVEADGSFVYDPAPGLPRTSTVTFKYGATDGVCDATGQATAKISVTCR